MASHPSQQTFFQMKRSQNDHYYESFSILVEEKVESREQFEK